MTKIEDLRGKAVLRDCVGAILFLASNDLSGYITGNIVHVNGGRYMP